MPDLATVKDALLVLSMVIILARWALRWRDARKGFSNGRSGDKSASYWEKTIGTLMQTTLTAHDERVHKPERELAAQERRQIQIKLNQLATSFELSTQEKQRQLAEALMEIKRQLRGDNDNGPTR